MDKICPICNGLSALNEICPTCRKPIVDTGPILNYYGPYSPYREIDDLKLSNGYLDLINDQCIHIGYCQSCHQEHLYFISEW